jgi:uncharacterized RDD family membrane protein YckC
MEQAAGFWRRFAAAFIDALVTSLVGGFLNLITGASDHGVRVWFSGGNGWTLLVSAVYFTFFHGRTGQTPGDAALGIRVVDIDSNEVIGYGRAFIRWIVSIVSGLVILLGYLWMLWDGRRQTWHDKAARSLPVHVGG